MSTFKPMLASKVNPDKLVFPLFVQPKLDGIRVTIVEGRALTRTLKRVPNLEIQTALSNRPELEGLDGELVVGSVTAEDAYRKTASFVMAPNKTGEDWCFHVFDVVHTDDAAARQTRLHYRAAQAQVLLGDRVSKVPFWKATNEAELNEMERQLVAEGHEGVIVRKPTAHYKYGRASATAGELGKVKRYTDFEAEVIGVYEEMRNDNEAVTNALGRTERSSVQANKTGKGTLGGLILRAINGEHKGVEFRCGTGFDAAQRADLWAEWHANVPHAFVGRVAKVKSFPIGVKSKPRHPVWLGWRNMEVDG